MGRTTGSGERRKTHRTHRWRRALLATVITGAVVVPLSGAARAEIPAPAPAAPVRSWIVSARSCRTNSRSFGAASSALPIVATVVLTVPGVS
ncbi:hypothetical protein EAO75_10510 [Streptomyces sp. uw30]|uniref:hypothetical protein n=1 Tax=Streptomyces sp. uw30 TaxID=1828179 RepID=UPI0011CD9293|nr:hypothetical protein [Streptomyces sp. uw30]TXS50226.1 hypothetical protein EAO75_10510 [Streptomyces sp. uw30]